MKRSLGLAIFLAAFAAGAAETNSDRVRAGCPVHVEAPVDGNLLGAGCEVSVDSTVSGNAWLAGGRVTIKEAVKGNLRAAGGNVLIDAPIEGDAFVAAGTLELGPRANIGGKLRYRADTFERDPEAQVANGIERSRRHSRDGTFGPRHRSQGGWIWTAGMMLLAGIFAALLPDFSGRMAAELRSHPWMPPLVGFVALVCVPIAAVLIMITIIGIPLGLLAILGYAVLLLVGYVCTSVVTGDLLLNRFKADAAHETAWRAGAAVLAMLALALIGRIPVVGPMAAFIALIVGVGLVVATVFHPRTPPSPAAAA